MSLNHNKINKTSYRHIPFSGLVTMTTLQLALVVIVPIVGGYTLDQHYHKSPWLLIAGIFFAIIGVYGVLNRVLTGANQQSNYFKSEVKKLKR